MIVAWYSLLRRTMSVDSFKAYEQKLDSRANYEENYFYKIGIRERREQRTIVKCIRERTYFHLSEFMIYDDDRTLLLL